MQSRSQTTLFPQKTALVLVEFQKQWTAPGLYNALIGRELRRRNVMENAEALARAARASGITVIHAPLVIDPKHKRGLFAWLSMGLVFRKGTTRAELDERVFGTDDLIAKGRYAFDAFIGSDLEELLRANGIKTVFLAGFTTDQCVAKTMKTAMRKNFDAYLVADCCATIAGSLHQATERRFNGRVLTTDALLTYFAGMAVSGNPGSA